MVSLARDLGALLELRAGSRAALTAVFVGVMPFVAVYMLAVLTLLAFPHLALFIVPR